MSRKFPRVLVLTVSAAAFAVTACSERKPLPAATPATPSSSPTIQPKPEAPPPPLSVTAKIELEADFAKARALVAEAMALKLKGEAIEREQGREAANDTFVNARKLYQRAVQATEPWVEPDAGGKVTAKQVERLGELQPYIQERERWIQDIASMGTKLNAR